MSRYKFIDEEGVKKLWSIIKDYIDRKIIPSVNNSPPNHVYAGPATGSDSGAPEFRALVKEDLPPGVPTEPLQTTDIDNMIKTN